MGWTKMAKVVYFYGDGPWREFHFTENILKLILEENSYTKLSIDSWRNVLKQNTIGLESKQKHISNKKGKY